MWIGVTRWRLSNNYRAVNSIEFLQTCMSMPEVSSSITGPLVSVYEWEEKTRLLIVFSSFTIKHENEGHCVIFCSIFRLLSSSCHCVSSHIWIPGPGETNNFICGIFSSEWLSWWVMIALLLYYDNLTGNTHQNFRLKLLMNLGKWLEWSFFYKGSFNCIVYGDHISKCKATFNLRNLKNGLNL